ncbi:MAG: transcription antitermination factor NusB [Proteobacteria bacterium]|nr:transcription antitermination factor NusB [Pseudomonadota bacterium]
MKSIAAARGRSRKFLVQALYQAQLMDESFASVVNAFTEEHNMKRADIDYFRDVMRGIHEDREVLESLITSRLDRGYDEIDPVEKGILLLGCYELRSRLDVPYRVVINEGVELAKSFGATDSFKYVNSILDSLARELRTAE